MSLKESGKSVFQHLSVNVTVMGFSEEAGSIPMSWSILFYFTFQGNLRTAGGCVCL